MKLLEKRSEVEKALHLSKNKSYLIVAPSKAAQGFVSIRKVCEYLKLVARNGAEIGRDIPDDFMDFHEIETATGLSHKRVMRILRRAPHFYLSRKTVLMHRRDVEKAFDR